MIRKIQLFITLITLSIILVSCGGAPSCSDKTVKSLVKELTMEATTATYLKAVLLQYNLYEDAASVTIDNYKELINAIKKLSKSDSTISELYNRYLNDSIINKFEDLNNYKIYAITCNNKNDENKNSFCSAIVELVPLKLKFNVSYKAFYSEDKLYVQTIDIPNMTPQTFLNF